jgi:hypothetical protein
MPLAPALSHAQTIDDTLMMKKGGLCTGFVYSHDRWEDYWEGELKRRNGNIGAITTQSITWMGTYGVTDRFNVIAMLPYVSTSPSQGVLRGQHGLQDVTIAAKYRVLQTSSLRGFLVASVGGPVSDYSPDLLPLSLGSASPRSAGRATLSYQTKQGLFASGSAAYTLRRNITLDREIYYTDGKPFFTDEVEMPNVADYSLSLGYHGPNLHVTASYMAQRCQGGGDIRRQDMPFPSNRMDFTRAGASVLYALPVLKRKLSAKLEGSRVLDGRNVGQATMISGGFLYAFQF